MKFWEIFVQHIKSKKKFVIKQILYINIRLFVVEVYTISSESLPLSDEPLQNKSRLSNR